MLVGPSIPVESASTWVGVDEHGVEFRRASSEVCILNRQIRDMACMAHSRDCRATIFSYYEGCVLQVNGKTLTDHELER